jgi:hypothetical protein
MPIFNGRIGKWILALSKFELRFESAKAVKGHIMVHQLICLKLLLGLYFLMDLHVAKVVE